MFSGAAVDSTVSEPEQQGHPTSTPARTLRLLHLSGQGTLVQESLSQYVLSYSVLVFLILTTHRKTLRITGNLVLPALFSRSSVDYVAPTPDTPLIVPSSPTEPENEHSKQLDLLQLLNLNEEKQSAG